MSPRRGLLSVLGVLSVAVLVGVVFIGVGAAGGTFALWNSSATIATASTVKSGSASLSVSALAGSGTKLYPGATSYQTATVTNTSPSYSAESVTPALALTLQSLTLTSTSTTFSSALSVSIGVVSSTGACASGFTPAWTGALGGVPSTPPGLAKTLVGSGSTAVLCVAVTLPSTVAAATQISATPTYSIVIGGTAVS